MEHVFECGSRLGSAHCLRTSDALIRSIAAYGLYHIPWRFLTSTCLLSPAWKQFCSPLLTFQSLKKSARKKWKHMNLRA